MFDPGTKFSVIHVVPALFDAEIGVVGGAERYALELSRHMADVIPTALVTFGPRDESRQVGRLTVRVLATDWFVGKNRQNPLNVRAFGSLRHASVIHCHQRYTINTSILAAVGRLTGRRVFVTDHGGGGWDFSSFFNTDRLYAGCLHVSEYSRRCSGHQDLVTAQVIHGGVDCRKFFPSPDRARRRLVVFVGRLLPHKGLDDLIQASDVNTPVAILGRVTDTAYLAHLRRLAAGRAITFHIDPTDEQVREFYQIARCAVLASVHVSSTYGGARTVAPELLGQTALEAMACGTPVIATDVTSLPEIVTHEECGLIVQPNRPEQLRAAICRLLDRPQEAEAMGAAALCRVRSTFSWTAVVARCLRFYGIGKVPESQSVVESNDTVGAA